MEALMTALAPTDLGTWLNERHIQVYGWVNAGANLSTANGAKDGNYPALESRASCLAEADFLPTVWAARYLAMNGKRRLIGSFWARPHLPVRSRGASWTSKPAGVVIRTSCKRTKKPWGYRIPANRENYRESRFSGWLLRSPTPKQSSNSIT